ncbi:DUF1707 and DUF4190 domain-containing protein [Streptomyces sp. NPDC005760]|uniref:DUF1707 and DUF4190 domain-containing protein n=1 Tax=Streptomyces sp. NPDC005760 TaxID=3156718 RepID=UPI0033D82059
MSQSSWPPWEGEGESPGSGVPGDGQDRGAPRQGPEASGTRPWSGRDVPATRPWSDAHAPVAHPWPGYAAPQPASSAMLASHADRERAVDVLRAGYGEGRLEKGEFDKRVERAYGARTVGELALLVSDLPLGPVPQPAPFTAVPRTFLPAPRPRANGKAVGAAVCGLLCVPTFGFTGIPAVILGHTARTEIERTGESGDGLALTGLVFGWLSIAAWSVLLTLLVAVGLASG